MLQGPRSQKKHRLSRIIKRWKFTSLQGVAQEIVEQFVAALENFREIKEVLKQTG